MAANENIAEPENSDDSVDKQAASTDSTADKENPKNKTDHKEDEDMKSGENTIEPVEDDESNVEQSGPLVDAKDEEKDKEDTGWGGCLGTILIILVIVGLLRDSAPKESGEEETHNTEYEETTTSESYEEPTETTIDIEEWLNNATAQERFNLYGESVFGSDHLSTTVNFDLENPVYDEDGEINEDETMISYVNVQVDFGSYHRQDTLVRVFLRHCKDYLELIQNENYDRVFIGAKAIGEDVYGNQMEVYAVKFEIPKSEVDKINFENFDYKYLPEIASQFWLNPYLDL